MARKTGRRSSRAARVPLSDDELIARLQEDAPDVLHAAIPENAFDGAIEGLLKESSSVFDDPHFYCRKCAEYHRKMHPHYKITG